MQLRGVLLREGINETVTVMQTHEVAGNRLTPCWK
jgi:hypothetical protein